MDRPISRRILFLPIFLSLILGSCQFGSDENAQSENVSRRYLVRFKDNWAQVDSSKRVLLRAMGGELKASDLELEHVEGNLYVMKLAEDVAVEDAIQKIRKSKQVARVEVDPVVHSFSRPNDPQLDSQWAHQVVNSFDAWDISQGSEDVVVAIVDTGIDSSHPDLKANIWTNSGEIAGNHKDDDGNGLIDDVHGWDFANNDSEPMADDAPSYHGTHVSGTIGASANNGEGGAGQSPVVKLMALKFLDKNGSGYVSNAIRAIHYAISKKARIISNSWGGPQGSQELKSAIEKANQAGILFVVAAGNGGQDGIGDNNDQVLTYPASYRIPNIISVAATGRSDQLTRFSNYGVQSVHVAAPGENILSTANGGNYQYLSGTSMATPLVSGILATMIAHRPDLNDQQIKKALMDSVDPIPALQGRIASGGRVNAYRALATLDGTDPGPDPGDPSDPTDPTPDPGPNPPPVGGIAKNLLLGGQTMLVVTNPYVNIPIDYDVSEFAGAAGAYMEVSRPNMGFSNPNGNTPDPMRLTYAVRQGLQTRLFVTPAQHLPGWGVYQFRVIPINAQGQAVGRFSNPSILQLRPFGMF